MLSLPKNASNGYWVTGPSGAGKTHLVEKIRSSKAKELLATFDLDFVGYRKPDEGQFDWHIPKEIFSVLEKVVERGGKPMCAVGCDSDFNVMLAAAVDAGFKPVMVVPDLATLKSNRVKRGDTPDKVEESERSIDSWLKRGKEFEMEIFASSSDLFEKMIKVIDHG